MSRDVLNMRTWERRHDETDKAWEAFTIYKEMPSTNRSVDEVSKQLKKSAALMYRWSGKYDWQSRVVDYDNHVLRGQEEVDKKLRAEARRQWFKRKEAQAERRYAAAEKIQAIVDQMTEYKVLRRRTVAATNEDGSQVRTNEGRPVYTEIFEPIGWRARDIGLLEKYAAALTESAFKEAVGDEDGAADAIKSAMVPAEAAVLRKALASYRQASMNGNHDPRSGESNGHANGQANGVG